MFVELVDCGHVVEVKTLDQWMDEPDGGSSGDVEIKHKRCPKCSTPILSSRRYGKIIKTIVADFEAVKRRILLNVTGSEQIQKILVEVQEIQYFRAEVEEIVQSIIKGCVTSEEVTKRQNQVTLLKFLCTIHNMVKYDRALYDKIHYLKSRVMKRRDCFSDQEIEEFIAELVRTKLLVCFKGLMTFPVATPRPEETKSVNSLQSTLESGDVIGKYNNLFR